MISRRHLLGCMAATPLFLRSMAAEAATSSDTIIVAIMMEGGNDGLNTVIPLPAYGTYRKLRSPGTPPANLQMAYGESDLAALAFDSNPATDAAAASQFAFAPSMAAMRKLYATGHLAVVAGVGLPAAEMNALSHYNAQNDWMTGQINISGQIPAGWLGLALEGAAAGELGATASLNGSSVLIAGSKSRGLALSSPIDNFNVFYGNSDNYTGLVSTSQAIMAMPAFQPSGTYAQGVLGDAVESVRDVKAIAAKVPAQDYPTPASALDLQLRDIARMILGGAGIRGYAAVQTGYDTHADQNLYQPALVSQLGTAMANFYGYLQSKGAARNVIVVTLSDFGRRPAANLDFGTDHGGASVGFVLGDAVKGGVFGDYPSLTALDTNQNLAVKVDFRNVISDIIQAAGGNAMSVLGASYPRLGFL